MPTPPTITEGPYGFIIEDGICYVGSRDDSNPTPFIARLRGPNQIGDAQRIAACLNAFAGIPTDEIEKCRAMAPAHELPNGTDHIILDMIARNGD